MSRILVTIAGGALFLSVAAARPGQCMADDEAVEAHVPFAFEVLGTHMPAGDYELTLVGTYEPGVVEIRGREADGPVAFFLGNSKDSGSTLHPEMVFDDVGNQKFLRAVLLPGEKGVELPVTSAEVQAARNVPVDAKRSQPADPS